MDYGNRNELIVIGHRGAPREAPENTISSFEKAVKAGVDCVECDLRRTQDGRVVVIHDRDVRRTTNGRGRVDSMSEDQLLELDAGAWFGKKFTGEKIPTLDGILEWGASSGARLILELKDREIEEFVARRIAAHEMEKNVTVCSWKPQSLQKMRELSLDISVAPILISANRINPKIVALNPAFIFLWGGPAMTRGVVTKLHAAGIKVIPWIVDSKPLLTRVLKRDVDGVITNEVSITASYIKDYQGSNGTGQDKE